MTEQTAIATLNAPQTLATMNPQGWRLVAAVNGQWTDTPSNAGVTMFFERDDAATVAMRTATVNQSLKSAGLPATNSKPKR